MLGPAQGQDQLGTCSSGGCTDTVDRPAGQLARPSDNAASPRSGNPTMWCTSAFELIVVIRYHGLPH
jgi:hypothetical protein